MKIEIKFGSLNKTYPSVLTLKSSENEIVLKDMEIARFAYEIGIIHADLTSYMSEFKEMSCEIPLESEVQEDVCTDDTNT